MFSCLLFLHVSFIAAWRPHFGRKNRPQKVYQGWSDIDHIYVMFKALCKAGMIPMKQWGKSWVFCTCWYSVLVLSNLYYQTPHHQQQATIFRSWFDFITKQQEKVYLENGVFFIFYCSIRGAHVICNNKNFKNNIPPFTVSPGFPFRSHQQTFMKQTKNWKRQTLLSSLQKIVVLPRLELHVTALHPIPSTWVVGEVVVAFQPWHRVLLSRRLSRSSWFRGKGTGGTWRERMSRYFKQFQW